MDESAERVKVHPLNILNVIAFAINVAITYGVGIGGWIGATNTVISDRYQTIVTPVGWAFSIWSIIFITEAIFVVAQLFPRFRSRDIVIKGVSYWFILACLFQAGWTVVFALEIIWLSAAVIISIALSLVALLISQYKVISEDKSQDTCVNYWLVQFPFEVHCGWLLAASVVNVNLVLVAEGYSAAVQTSAGIVSLAVLLMVATLSLFFPTRPNDTIPLVLAWASGCVAAELNDPKDAIIELFDESIIVAMKYASASISVIILITTAVRFLLSFLAKYVKFFSCFSTKTTTVRRDIESAQQKVYDEDDEN